MPKQIPCLWFDGRAEEAAQYYVSVFPDSAVTQVTRGPEGRAMTVSFSLDGHDYVALNGGPQFTFTEAVSFQIHCADQDEVDHYWSRLTDGGQESQCGWLKDRFGVSWQVVPVELFTLLSDPDPGRAQRATQAMLQMRKIDVATMRRAADSVPA
jgi:predicted 3-demethylubiquinone-9 3-methyltransferase (glyoxalase superfamily)